jgi:AcrR family transcriptional regulator
MIIYYRVMRYKDESKKEAIIKATVELVNQIGFVSSSVSKIAKAANVSPATIYIYYKNKDDLLVSTYVEIKQKLSAAMLKDFDDSQPIRDVFQKVWFNSFEYITENPQYFYFTEQFSYSPYSSLVDKKEMEKYFEPLYNTLVKGVEQKILKDVPFDVLTVFMFYPVMLLSNPRVCANFQLNKKNIEIAFTMGWDAVKL